MKSSFKFKVTQNFNSTFQHLNKKTFDVDRIITDCEKVAYLEFDPLNYNLAFQPSSILEKVKTFISKHFENKEDTVSEIFFYSIVTNNNVLQIRWFFKDE